MHQYKRHHLLSVRFCPSVVNMVRSPCPVLYFSLTLLAIVEAIRVAPRVEITSDKPGSKGGILEGAASRSHMTYRLVRSGHDSRPRFSRYSMGEASGVPKCPLPENQEKRSGYVKSNEERSREPSSLRYEKGFEPSFLFSRGVEKMPDSDSTRDFSSDSKFRVKSSYAHAAMIPVSLVPVYSLEEPTAENRLTRTTTGGSTSETKGLSRYYQGNFPIPVQLYPVHINDKISFPLKIPVALEFEPSSSSQDHERIENPSLHTRDKSLLPYQGRTQTTEKSSREQSVECPYVKNFNGHGFYENRRDHGDFGSDGAEKNLKSGFVDRRSA